MSIINLFIVAISILAMDFGMGLIITFLLQPQNPTIMSYFLGGLIALLPDSDLIWCKIRGDEPSNHKYYWTHYPIFMFAIGLIIGQAINYPTLPYLWLAHLIHDGFEPQGTLVVLGPFNKKTFHFSLQKRSPFIKIEGMKLEVVSIEEWTQKNYLQWSPESTTSRIVLLIGILLMVADIWIM
jgi:hypothetical protein